MSHVNEQRAGDGDSVAAFVEAITKARENYRKMELELAAHPELFGHLSSVEREQLESMRKLFAEWPNDD